MAMGQAVATANLYGNEHPSREKACDVLFHELKGLLAATATPRFSFLGDEVIFGRLAMRGLRDWSLGARLSRAGIQWLEFEQSATRDDIRGFIEDAAAILAAPTGVPLDPLLFRRQGIRWGAVVVRGAGMQVSEPGGGYQSSTEAPAHIGQTGFEEEIEAARWIASSLNGSRAVPIVEAQAVIRSLAVVMHQERDILQPLYRLSYSSDTTSHTIGVSILAMSFAEFLGMQANEISTIGIAALLHDVGLGKVPREILDKAEALTPEEEAEYRMHTLHGARMLLGADGDLSLAALVAYEHHLCPDGTGYPELRHPREVNVASRMISICSSYHSRRSNRPFRPALDGRAVLNHIEWYAGTKYDAELGISFAAMMRELEDKAVEKQSAD
jgi:hypothetical protein